MKTNKHMTQGMSIGMCIGISFGLVFGQILFDSVGVGMCFGLSIGMSLGMSIGALKDQKINKKALEKGCMVKEIKYKDDTECYSIVIVDKNGVEKTVYVSSETMESENFCVGETVIENENGTIEQAFEKEDL